MASLPRRRSCLSVPGASDKMLAKALSLAADELVLDLEDAVPAGDKDAARDRVAGVLASPEWRARRVAVRVNAIGTPWCHQDVLAIVATAHEALTLVVPKVESPGDLAFMDRLLAGAEAAAASPVRFGLQALIETARGLAAVTAIAGASPRLETLILGYADLASSLGRPPGSRESWQSAQDAVVVAARAHGLQPIDGPYFRIVADETLGEDCDHARRIGFDGKWAIHPSHLATINAAFTPGDEEVAAARALLAQLDRNRTDGVGASAFAGGMVDEAMRLSALRTLDRAGLRE